MRLHTDGSVTVLASTDELTQLPNRRLFGEQLDLADGVACLETPDLLALKYIEALPQLAQGQASSLFLIPSDVAAALGGLATMGAAFRQGGDVSAGGGAPPAATT